MINRLSHFDKSGDIKMVDVSAKDATKRTAIASARILMKPETLEAIKTQTNPKGNPLEIARIAGILAAKQTSNLIPLCHQIALSKVDIRILLEDFGVYLESEVSTTAQTGVEMEALTAVSVAALTIYDMCKAVEKEIVIGEIKLEKKTGGKSGEFHRAESA